MSFPPPNDDDVQVPHLNNFITRIIEDDIAAGRIKHTVTRFPPEPNGWLHLGHAKSICLNFGLAKQYGGKCHLRFDDTNPAAEEHEYIEGIKQDVRWLGWRWNDDLYFASDYFGQLYEWAEDLIKKGLAYVDEQTEEEVRANRGTVTEPGKNSPYRDTSVEENLQKFRDMRDGKYEDGAAVLRAKIDMAHGNMNMRDPPIYRIKRNASHPRTGTKWCVYPIYDFAHGQSDSIENITHSICTLEFYDHRMLYDWFQEKLGITRTQQLEFARFNLSHTVMSKRRLLKLVQENFVRGWDDPRMPTLAGCRRRGVPARAIRDFAYSIGVAKRENTIPMLYFENTIRDSLENVPRKLAVIKPLKVTITNWDARILTDDEKTRAKCEDCSCTSVECGRCFERVTLKNHPEVDLGTREGLMGRTIYIDATDFAEVPPAGWHRLTVGGEVRLRYGYWLKCNEVVKDEGGAVLELRCTIDPSTRAGAPPSEKRKVKGVIHWVDATDSVAVELRMYQRLFTVADPDEGGDWVKNLNPQSLLVENGRAESSVATALKALRDDPLYKDSKALRTFQFERVGFFTIDPDSTGERLVFNLTIDLVDTFAGETEAKHKEEAKLAREKAAEERRLKKLAKEEAARKKREAATTN